MKYLIVLLMIFIFLVKKSTAQHTPNRWVIGSGFTLNASNNILDFSSGTLNIINPVPNPHHPFDITNASIGDANGNLLFYTNGISIYNAQHNKIQNGDTISPSLYTLTNLNYGLALPQGTVFIPDPTDTNRCYLFHSSADLSLPGCPNLSGNGAVDKIYYSIIDKSLDSGNGGVVSKNNLLLSDTLGFCLIAIKHGNGRDWWITTRQSTFPVWYSWLVSDTGIAGPFTQSIGPVACLGFWNLKFSASTNKIAGFRMDFNWPTTRYIDLYDFDRCTGLFSNPLTLQMNNIAKYIYSGGCEFSPSGRYLYGGAVNKLYQFDMLAPNIQGSMAVIDSTDSLDFGNYKMWGVSQLAPDGKIYSKIPNSIPFLSVINYPDSAGNACNAMRGGIALPNYHYGDLPNIPLYELGSLVGSGCDTITGSPPAPDGGDLSFKIYPNPVVNELAISSSQLAMGQTVTVAIYDMLGKVQLQQTVIPQGDFIVDVNALSSGIYMLQLKQEDRLFNGRFVKE
jgi:hypothetical protein